MVDQKPTIPTLTGLRFVAALGVVPAVILLVAASLASQRWIETPARRWIRALARKAIAQRPESRRDLYPSIPIAS